MAATENKLQENGLNSVQESKQLCLGKNIVKVQLQKDSGKGGLGFNIVGGIDKNHVPGHPEIFISRIRSGTPAAHASNLNPGDIILSVNGIDLSAVTHDKAVEILRNVDTECNLVLEQAAEKRILKNTETVDISTNFFALAHETKSPPIKGRLGNVSDLKSAERNFEDGGDAYGASNIQRMLDSSASAIANAFSGGFGKPSQVSVRKSETSSIEIAGLSLGTDLCQMNRMEQNSWNCEDCDEGNKNVKSEYKICLPGCNASANTSKSFFADKRNVLGVSVGIIAVFGAFVFCVHRGWYANKNH